jgi:hypothetical protein
LQREQRTRTPPDPLVLELELRRALLAGDDQRGLPPCLRGPLC